MKKHRKSILVVLALVIAPFALYMMYLAGLVAHDELLGVFYTKELGRAVMAQPMPEGVTLRGAAAYRGSLEKGTYVSCEVYLVAESNLSREEMEVRFEAWEKQLCEAMDGDACTVRVLDGAEAQEAFWQARWYENVRAALPSMEDGCWLVAIGGRTFDMMTNDGVTDRAYRLYP